MYGYSVPAIINHSIFVDDEINPPAGNFSTSVDNAAALDGFGAGSGSTGVHGRSVDGSGIWGSVQGAGVGIRGDAIPDNSTAVVATAEGANSIGVFCHSTQSTGAAVLIEGKIRVDQAIVHTLGSYSGKAIPIYDTNNALLGYVPLYA